MPRSSHHLVNKGTMLRYSLTGFFLSSQFKVIQVKSKKPAASFSGLNDIEVKLPCLLKECFYNIIFSDATIQPV